MFRCPDAKKKCSEREKNKRNTDGPIKRLVAANNVKIVRFRIFNNIYVMFISIF